MVGCGGEGGGGPRVDINIIVISPKIVNYENAHCLS